MCLTVQLMISKFWFLERPEDGAGVGEGGRGRGIWKTEDTGRNQYFPSEKLFAHNEAV